MGYNYDKALENDPSSDRLEYTIEADASTAAFDVAYSAIYGQPIILKNLSLDGLQGEIEIIKLLDKHFEGFECMQAGEGIYVKGREIYTENNLYT